jgi:parallel beta-helix repeat protein
MGVGTGVLPKIRTPEVISIFTKPINCIVGDCPFGTTLCWLLLGLACAYSVACPALPRQQTVRDSSELIQAIENATAGSEITVAPGEYSVYRVDSHSGGTESLPITVKAANPAWTVIKATGIETFSIHHPYWIFENLTIRGGPESEHAFHVTGSAHHLTLRGNVMVNFHASVKVNGDEQGFPDFGLLENNDLYNESIRQTDSPVTLMDIVGGQSWVIRGNYLADFSKGESDQTSYGLFLKGNSSHGLVEQNLVICAQSVSGPGIRVGVSLGGGGTGQAYCVNRDCEYEHSHGVIRNNIILNCSDVGIYLNRARETLIEHNTLLLTSGIDVRFAQSSAWVRRNIVSGAIRERDGGRVESADNSVFGHPSGMFLPILADKLKSRIADYDEKFPRWVNAEQVKSWQSAIDRISSRLTQTDWGLGVNKTNETFPMLALGDLTPERIAPFILPASEPSQDKALDFWGHHRSSDKVLVGAIDFFVSPCNITLRIRHQEPGKIKPCLRQ